MLIYVNMLMFSQFSFRLFPLVIFQFILKTLRSVSDSSSICVYTSSMYSENWVKRGNSPAEGEFPVEQMLFFRDKQCKLI